MTETTAFAAYPPLTDIVDIAIDEMLRSVAVPTEEEDRDLAEQALIAIARNYLYRQVQLWAVGLGEESGAQQGPQLDCPISQENICAEVVTLLRAGGRRLRKVAVGHKKTNAEGGQVHNVVMCEGCRSRYLTHNNPRMLSVIPYRGEILVVPSRVLYPYTYEENTLRMDLGDGFNESDPIAQAIIKMLRATGRQPDQMEIAFAEEAKISVKRTYAELGHREFSLGLTANGDTLKGLQSPFPVGMYPCSCVRVVVANCGTGVGMKTLVTAYINKEGKARIGVLDPLCRGRFLAHEINQKLEVIIWLQGGLWAVPLRALLPLPYKVRNGNHQQFQG